jgi:hypothetical protein
VLAKESIRSILNAESTLFTINDTYNKTLDYRKTYKQVRREDYLNSDETDCFPTKEVKIKSVSQYLMALPKFKYGDRRNLTLNCTIKFPIILQWCLTRQQFLSRISEATISSDQQVRTCHFLILVSTSQTKQNVYLDHPLYESYPTSSREC